MRRLSLLAGAVSLLGSLTYAQPRIELAKTQVIASGVTPGGTVACLAVWRKLGETMPRQVHFEQVARDEDGDGEVAFELGREIPPVSVWAIADLTTGGADVVPGPETAAKPVEAAADLLGSRHDGSFAFADRRSYLALLIVRPGEDVWTLNAGDGGEGDDDQAPDGVIVPALARSRSLVVTSGHPVALRAGDTVVAIDPATFEYYTARLGRGR